MKLSKYWLCIGLLFPALIAGWVLSQTVANTPPGVKVNRSARAPVGSETSLVCKSCIRAHEEFLASDAMQGRGSATPYEWVAATYIAAELQRYGIRPAGENGGYMQRAAVRGRHLTSAPTLTINAAANAGSPRPVVWEQGNQFLTVYLSQAEFSGPLQKIDAASPAAKANAGAIVLIKGDNDAQVQRAALDAVSKGAVAELVVVPANSQKEFSEAAKRLPKVTVHLEGEANAAQSEHFNMLELTSEAFQTLLDMSEGTELHFAAPAEDEKTYTWNAIGILLGSDPQLRHSAVLLSAHLDHLGIGQAVSGDNIYNGADDDASGTAAVLELARVLGKGIRPRRTVIFAFFGSEEIGGFGSTYFREHPPVPLKDIAANLEFEMIGRSDPLVKNDMLWLTGWERSNLGPALAAHGAHLTPDPHPNENFFARSDNYILAKKGVVAQAVSSFGLHKDYHQPSDDLAHLDFKHMDSAIGSLLRPVEWLVNSNFSPQWNKGGQP